MKTICPTIGIALFLTTIFGTTSSGQDLQFSSGSTGADGPLSFPQPLGYNNASSLQPMSGTRAVYDSARQKITAFGGFVSFGLFGFGLADETFAWNGTTWDRIGANGPRRASAHLAFDEFRGQIVMFGGDRGEDDTRLWDGNAWTNVSAATHPTARSYAAIAYDAERKETILFGGNQSSNGVDLSDTWSWNGTAWTLKNPATKPSPRSGAAMAFDPIAKKVILYGGSSDETWAWDGTNWQLLPVSAPPSSSYHVMTYDSARQRILMAGGNFPNGDVWSWTGTNWVSIPTTGDKPASLSGFMVYDPIRNETVAGGDGFKTWILNGSVWRLAVDETAVFDMTQRASGVWNFTTINVPAGVTVKFKKNTTNTPVRWLATGRVLIEGTLKLDGEAADWRNPGEEPIGGPGGFSGGLGGASNVSESQIGIAGGGPGGGQGGASESNFSGKAGSFSGAYGNSFLQPLLGGSGGGGSFAISGLGRPYGLAGGGGGGAIEIRSSRDIELKGAISAIGGVSMNPYENSGSGGAVKLVADRIIGGGGVYTSESGRIRIESLERPIIGGYSGSRTSGPPVQSIPAVANAQLFVSSIAGQSVTQNPTANTASPDVVFSAAGNVTITVTSSGLPDGTPVSLRINHSQGVITLPAVGGPAVVINGNAATFTAAIPAGTGTIQAIATAQPTP